MELTGLQTLLRAGQSIGVALAAMVLLTSSCLFLSDLCREETEYKRHASQVAWQNCQSGNFKRSQIDTVQVASGEVFGTREFLKNNYLYRMTAAILGIYGNSKAEAMCPLHAAGVCS